MVRMYPSSPWYNNLMLMPAPERQPVTPRLDLGRIEPGDRVGLGVAVAVTVVVGPSFARRVPRTTPSTTATTARSEAIPTATRHKESFRRRLQIIFRCALISSGGPLCDAFVVCPYCEGSPEAGRAT